MENFAVNAYARSVSSKDALNAATVFEQVARRQIKPTYGINREFFTYNEFSKNTLDRHLESERARQTNMGYVTQLFNAYCSENGVQCTVTMDPNDVGQLFHFKNVGDRQVKITHLDQIRIIAPGEQITMKVMDSRYALADQSRLPQIETIAPQSHEPLESAGWVHEPQESVGWVDYKGSSL